jgi:phenylacetate-coenzyme A ligase PaaK-like adenylate-forming protein
MKVPCPCGRAALAISAIEGRSDDVLWLESAGGRVPVFPDVLTRAIVSVLPEVEDFRIVEHAPAHWSLQFRPLPSEHAQRQLRQRIASVVEGLGAPLPSLVISELAVSKQTGKQRRVLCLRSRACAS